MPTIQVSDALACHKLLNECAELRDDATAWQDHLLEGSERLIGGFGAALKLWRGSENGPIVREASLGTGCDQALRAQFARCVSDSGHRLLPGFDARLSGIDASTQCVVRYSQLAGGIAAYHGGEFYQLYLRTFAVGDSILGLMPLRDGNILTLMVLRERSDRLFNDRHGKLLGFLNSALAGEVGVRLPTTSQPGRHQLSPRLAQTLDHLLEGSSEKQIAARLELQPGTVHEYVRTLYRRYRVSSRAELMALHVRRRHHG